METRLYLASVEALKDEALFAALLPTVPAWRREKALAFKTENARRLSLGAGLLLAAALRDAGLEAGEIAFGEYGKPWFPALPDFHFSLSHSSERVLCAVADTPVGCDVEAPRRCDAALARRFFHRAEKEWLFSLPKEEQRDAFFRLWTCKESFIKALGLGLSLPLDSFAVLPGGELEQTADPRPWRLRSFRDGDCFCALCGLGDVDSVPLERVNWGEVSA